MRALLILTVVFMTLQISAPVAAQKLDPLTGRVVEQAPPPEPTGPDLSEAFEKVNASQFEEAEAILAGLQEQFPDDIRVLALRGELLVSLGRAEEAAPVLVAAAKIDPERPRVHFHLGTALATNGDKSGAIAAFGRELERSTDPQVRLLAHLNRSMLYEQGRQFPEAAGELEAALELDSTRRDGWANLISLRIESGDLDGALSALEKGAAAGFTSARHAYSVGARLFKAERFADAKTVFSGVLEIDPKHARAVRSLAACQEKLGEDEAALASLARYLELAPGASDADQIAQKLRAAGK